MRKICIILFALITFSLKIFAQDQPLYNQFFFNPYLYNPAFLTSGDVSQIFITYRNQWTNIQDSPKLYAFNGQYASRGNVALGISIQSEISVLLQTNTGYLTFAYKVPFNQNHYLKFGLSAGFLHNRLDFDELFSGSDPGIINDPAIANALDDTYYFSSQFGIQYKLKGLSLGFSLPKLLNNSATSDQEVNEIAFSKLSHKIATASYRASISPTIDIEPIALYRFINENQDQIELSGLFYYKEDLVWAGLGYRYEYGAMGYFGLNLLNSIQVGYSYEFPQSSDRTSFGSTHEIHLRLKLKRKPKKVESQPIEEEAVIVAPVIETIPEEPVQEEPIIIEEKEIIEEVETEPEPEPVKEIEPEPILTTPVESEPTPGMPKGHYVIVGAFTFEENATEYQNKLISQNYSAKIAFNRTKQLFYVHLFYGDSIQGANTMRDELRNLNFSEFEDAWILSID